MEITISDVAKAAGVSKSTVSKVLNGWTTISPETTARVNKVIQELNFIPNARAVSFAKRASKNIVFLTSLGKEEAYKNPHMFDIMCGVHNELSKYNYTVTLVDTSKDTHPGESVEKIISAGSADGIIVHGSALNEGVAQDIVTHSFPHVVIGNPGFESQLCWIDTNNMLGGQFAAEHLIDCGYSNVAFIGGKKSDFISSQRLKGLRQTMLRNGKKMNIDNIYYTDSTIPVVMKATEELMSSDHAPDAIVCENNLIAVGVSKEISKLGLGAPDDIAFLTFDRYPYTGVIDPVPTIVDIDVYDMGIQAGNTIQRKLENPSLLVQSYTTLPILIQGNTTRNMSS